MAPTLDDERRVLDAVPTGLLIGGDWQPATDNATFTVEDPSTGRPLTEVADANPDDAVRALDAAVEAQEQWRNTAPRERGEVLRRAFEVVVERADDIALLLTLEMGKSLAESRQEVTYAAEFLRWFSEEAVRIDGRWSRDPAGSGRLLTMKQPVGPCLLITPWNFPAAMITRKVGPAVAAGCTMVVKPAANTPLTMLALAQVLIDVGLPDGVLNVITSSRSGAVMGPLIADPRARKLSFTGSTPVGKKLAEQASGTLLRLSMELGGNAPFLVFDDADLDAAVDGAVVAKMRNIGESCVAANRFHVHESVAEEFGTRLAGRLAALQVGRGTEDAVDVGPLINQEQRAIVVDLVADAVGKGATALTGGQAADGPGYFYPPTVLTGVTRDARILTEEVFGPIAPIITFATEQEAVQQANDTSYGLVAYVYTRGLERALRVVEGLDVGMVGLNKGTVSNPAAPFGGVKESGYGREGGREGIEEYLSVKYVALAVSGLAL